MSRWAPDAALRLERAAMELFAEYGYSATTVPSIAERAGLTTRTFFRHFPDKRDVLFLRERELPEVVARLLAGAPAGLDPLGLLMHGLETVAGGDLEGWRGEIAARRAVIVAEPALRERELLKSAVLADAMRDALVERSVPAEDAALAARTAAALFDASLEQWLGGRDSTLVAVLREQRARLQRLVGPAEQAGPPE
ncbi:helix-turn-helix domain-containing protein [Rathayibacter festucae]|uniref:TetR/AcrR family transcriptional regulator n=1 Tax=Rathayibacter festucae TaxID=110937 RepID=UPI002A6AC9B9|nr:helix-turn-helix domain-containing protein [Rathayibacter festucae]MDY0912724.1 helix-turn-helix domain-containing protein [Rathayibacter festucae]